MATAKPLVLISGATGYIGAWVVREFLDHGYSVRGTVRDLKKTKGKEHLKKWIEQGDDLKLVEASLGDASSWDPACQGCDFVVHVASPFFMGCSDTEAEEKLFKPAREGTLNVLRAAKKAGTVKRVVVTSSITAMYYGYETLPDVIQEPEKMWTNLEGAKNYERSKTMAEQAVWDYMRANENEENMFDLATINPALVLGPPLSTGWATSHAFQKRLLNSEMPMLPDFGFGTVDVRDVAKAHRLAIEKPAAAGNRFALQTTATPVLRYARIVHSEFKKFGYNFSTMKSPYFLLWLAAFFDKELNDILPEIGKVLPEVNCAKAKTILGMEFIPEKQSIVEHAHGCLQLGIAGYTQTKQYKQALQNREIPCSPSGIQYELQKKYGYLHSTPSSFNSHVNTTVSRKWNLRYMAILLALLYLLWRK